MFAKLIQRFTSKTRTARTRKPSQRRLRMERLDKRELLAGDINSISGTVYNDLTGNGLTGDDPRLSGIEVRLWRDGGDNTFSGPGVGDDTQVGAPITTGVAGTYLFEDLIPGRYFLQQVTAPVGLIVPAPTTIDITRNTTEVIDAFNQTPVIISATAGATTAESNLATPEAIGDRRKIVLTYGGGTATVDASVNTATNRFTLGSSDDTFGTAILRYDGDGSSIALNPIGLDPAGLGIVNLSAGDADSGLVLQVFRETAIVGQFYTLRVYTDANNFSQVDRLFNPAFINANYLDFVPFSSFGPGVGATGPANFTDVGAIELLVTTVADQNIRVSVFEAIEPRDLTVDLRNLENEAELAITKTLLSVVGAANSIRTATFRVDVTNNGVLPATGVTVADVFPNGMTFGSIGTVGNPGLPPAGVTVASTVGNTTTFNLTDLANGASRSFLVIANIAAGTAGTTGDLDNQVTVDANEPDNSPANNVATADGANLSIVKTVETTTAAPIPPATVRVGDTIVYRLVVGNAGPDNATGVSVVDTLPAGVRFVSGTINGGVLNAGIAHNAGMVTATIGNLPNAAQAIVLITAEVEAAAADLVNNVAVVSNTPGTDLYLGNNSSNVNTTITREVDLAVGKVALNPTTLALGGTVTYEITVTNLLTSPGNARGFTVTDTLPVGLTFVPGSFNANGSGVTLNAVGQVLTFTGVPLPVGDDVTFSFNATISQTATIPLENSVEVEPFDNGTSADIDLIAGNNTAAAPINPTRQVNLVVTKDDGIADGAFATPGVINGLVYSITVTNTGVSNAVNVNVIDELPDGVIATQISGGGVQNIVNNVDTGIVSFIIPSVPAGGAVNAVTVLVTATIGAALTGPITNEVEINGGGVGDPIAGNTATVTTNLQPRVDASITKAGPATAIPGETVVTYTLRVVNDGPSVATNVVVTDLLPAGLSSPVITRNGVAVTNTGAGNNVQFTIPTLLVGEGNAIEYQLTATLAPSATTNLSNVATVTAPGDDDPMNDSSLAVLTTLVPVTQIGVSQTVSANNVEPGDELTYTITVTNAGPSTAQNVTFQNVSPVGLVNIRGTGPGGVPLVVTGRTIEFAIGALAPGAAANQVFTIIAEVDDNIAGVLNNQATVTTTPDNQGGTPILPDSSDLEVISTLVDPSTGRIAGRVFDDKNNDGIFDAGSDVPRSGLTITLRSLDPAFAPRTTTTNTQGQWEFRNLPAGTYEVQLTRPEGFLDGLERPGGGVVVSLPGSTIPGIVLGINEQSLGNDIGVLQALSKRRFLASAFPPTT